MALLSNFGPAIGAQAGTEILLSVVAAAKGGDMRAADILLRRVWPERKGRPVLLDLPPTETSADLGEAMGAILRAAARGELTPDEAVSIANLIETRRRTIETLELERRIATLEQRETP